MDLTTVLRGRRSKLFHGLGLFDFFHKSARIAPVPSLPRHRPPPSPHGFELFRDLPQRPIDLEVGPLLEGFFTQGAPAHLSCDGLKKRWGIKEQIQHIPLVYRQ